MTPFQYLLVLVTILVSLAIADIVKSLHGLLRARDRIRWHWHPLAIALLVLLSILEFSWKFYRIGRVDVWNQYGAFLLLMLHLILLFLLASSALPDDAKDGPDMEEYYLHNRKYFWSLFALFAISAICVNLVAAFPKDSLHTLIVAAIPNLVLAILMLSLTIVRNKVYHSGCIVLFLFVMVLGWWQMGLHH